ncbi:hypothetical protein [Paeniglutamicibacter terrestris]|uniref:Uncharacterized protein n=1 Tax=Paeniglutamicibacter terrestris TaxID=2723403 RepID=A0ABX1G5S1_9MICC|nr:hypothetical protein [Paeniglutamicibacter terrestris]NKG21061.1 hypothetical protein [Paeniglutamicibacter terrestris]
MTDQPATDTLSFHLTSTSENGITIPVHVVATYPEGHGFYALKALENLQGQTRPLYRQLLARQDMTMLMVMASIRGIPED